MPGPKDLLSDLYSFLRKKVLGNSKIWAKLVFALSLVGFSNLAMADYQLNMTRGVTPISNEIHSLHMIILWICVGIGVVVYGLMIYSMLLHRKSRGAKAASFHESTTVEIIWTIIPFIILFVMGAFATRTLIVMEDTSDADITIKVTGYRWYWHYDYLDDDINFFSYLATPEDEINNIVPKSQDYLLTVDNNMVVPTGKKVRLVITSKDVIHSWWVPALGGKKDGIPGFATEMWFKVDEDKPGLYRGQCAELCGAKHGYMPIVVEAKAPQDYDKWIAEQKSAQSANSQDQDKEWTMDELMVKGEKEYNTVCAMCHQTSGKGLPPTFPSLVGSEIVTNKDRIVDHIKNVLNGKNAMPPFKDQKSDLEIAAIVTYERNAWGNNTKDVVQPKDVKQVRDAQN